MWGRVGVGVGGVNNGIMGQIHEDTLIVCDHGLEVGMCMGIKGIRRLVCTKKDKLHWCGV